MDVQRGRKKNMYKKRSGQTYYTNRHSCFLLQYHIVLVTKYRRPVLTGPVKDLVYRVIQDIFDEKKTGDLRDEWRSRSYPYLV